MAEEAEKKPEVHQPGVLTSLRKKAGLRWTDIVVFTVIIIVVIGMASFIFGKLRLKNEVTQAQTVSDKVLSDMAKQNTVAIRALGDKSFQSHHTAAELNSDLTATLPDGSTVTFGQLYGSTTPKVDKQIVTNNSRGQHVTVIYRYNKLKLPFFVRIDTIKPPHSGKWYLQAFSASPDESKLLGQ